MDTPDGPHAISAKRQVGIPKPLAEAAGLHPGDLVYFARSDVDPSVLVLIPASLLNTWIAGGRRAARSRSVAGTTDRKPAAGSAKRPARRR
jgi:bifunctional DNA-binding transcriptional regulator/antitoxin component of YhaV-PrlF toxin-antitoxin module